jgi:hypothetical protein
MELTADNLLSQIEQVIVDKLNKQDLDPKLLSSALLSHLKKLKVDGFTSLDSSKTNKLSLIEQIKQAFKELIKDQSYVNEYEKFNKKTSNEIGKNKESNTNSDELTESVKKLIKEKNDTTKSSSFIEAIKKQFKELVINAKTQPQEQNREGRKQLLQERQKPQEVILSGFTERGSRILKDTFGGFFKGFFDKLKGFFDKLQTPKGGFGLVGGALALLFGGLAALVGGLMTDGPFKGLLKILSQAGIQGAVKMLEFAAKIFMANLKLVLGAPLNLLKDAAKVLGRFFGKDAYKTILAPLRGLSKLLTGATDDLLRIITTSISSLFSGVINTFKTAIVSVGKQILNILPKAFSGGLATTILKPLAGLGGIFKGLFGGLLAKITPLLKPIPLIGFAISLGFAYSRYKKGDVVGATIDLLSGIASFIPGVGTAISFGLGMLNAILDFKAGGSSAKASEKKSNVLGGWLKGLGGLVLKGLKSLPIIGPAIKAFEEFNSGNYLKGIKQLAYIATPLEFIGALLGDKEASGITKTGASVVRGIGSILKNLGEWVASTIWKVLSNIPIMGPALKGAKELFSGNFSNAFKQFLYINPAFEFLGSLLGDREVGAITGATAGAIQGIGSALKNLGVWVHKQVVKIPVIGPLIKMANNFANGEWKEGLKNLGRVIGLGGLISFFESKSEETGGDTEKIIKNPFTALREVLLAKARKWWKSAWSWVRWLARRVLPTSVIKALDQEANEKIESEFNPDKGENIQSSLSKAFSRLKDAFKGALENVSKSIGNVIGSVKDGAKNILSTGVNAAKGLTNTLKNTKDKVFEKVSGFFKSMTSSVTSGIKKWWSNSSFNPGTWSDPKTENRSDRLQANSNERLQKELAAASTDEERQKILEKEENAKKMLAETAKKLGVSGTPEEIVQKRKEKQANNINNTIQKLEGDKNKKGFIYNLVQPYLVNKLKQNPAYKEFYSKEKNTELQNTTSKTLLSDTTQTSKTTESIKVAPTDNVTSVGSKIETPTVKSDILSNDTLKLIATNTGDTNASLKILSTALLKLVVALDKKITTSGNGTTIVNNMSQGSSKQTPSVAQVVNSNVDPIRSVRQQFRQMQFA